MVISSYNLSFTAGGLLVGRSLIVVNEFIKHGSWQATKVAVQRNNLLQSRTLSSGNRILREICKRLQSLTNEQITVLQAGTPLEQKQLLWLAVCKRYNLLADFSRKVVRGRFLELDLALEPNDFDVFVESQSTWHPELEKITDSTRSKLRQVTFRMLREAGIVDSDNLIQAITLSTDVARVIRTDSSSYFSLFPVSEADIREVLA